MPYETKPLSCDPVRLTGLSKKFINSHYARFIEGNIEAWKNGGGQIVGK